MPDIRRLTGTDRPGRRRWSARLACIALTVAVAACGGDDPVVPEPDEAIEPFVGTWDADVYTMTSVEDPSVVADVIGIGGSFTLNVQPSGTYTATLVFTDGENTLSFGEIGELTVGSGFITLRPTQPPADPSTAEYTFLSAEHLRLEGPSEFDFNFDGEDEAVESLIELRRR